MNYAGTLARIALTYGNRPAISKGVTVQRRYSELADRVTRLAASMRGPLGLAPGDRVALIMKNCVEDIEVMYASWKTAAPNSVSSPRISPRRWPTPAPPRPS